MMQSVLGQIEQRLQIILVDDGSTDDTLTRLFEWKKRFDKNDLACEILRKPNGGIASAINLGLRYFTGKYVCFPDADDALEPDYISAMVTYLEENPAYDVVRCDHTIINEINNQKKLADKDFSKHGFFKTLLLGNLNTNIWPMLFRSDFLRGRIPNLHLHESGKLGAQEWQLLLPLTYKTEVAYIKKPLYNYYFYLDSHSQISMGDRSEASLLAYSFKIREDISATVDTMPFTYEERGLYRDIAEFRIACLNMGLDNLSESARYTCAILLAYQLHKYTKSIVKVEALMIPERFLYHSQRLRDYFLHAI